MNNFAAVRSVLFDVNDVLVTFDRSNHFFSYLVHKAKEDPRIDLSWRGNIDHLLFGLLTRYCPLCEYELCRQTSSKVPGSHVRMARCEGQLTNEALKVCFTYVLTHYVDCPPKVRIILDYAAEYFTTPALFLGSCAINEHGMALLRQAVKRYGREGVFVFSNFSPESLPFLERACPELFQLLPEQNLIFAGHTGLSKPRREAFENVINRVGGASHSMLLIDDSATNIATAKSGGMQGIQYSVKPSAELERWQQFIGLEGGSGE